MLSLSIFILVITVADVENKIKRFVPKDAEIRILGIHAPSPIEEFDEVIVSPKDTKEIGRRLFSLSLIKGERIKRGVVSVYVEKYVKVPCATRDILRGEVMTEEDFLYVKKPLSLLPGDWLKVSPVGRKAKTKIRKGEVIRDNALFRNWLVRKGNRVVMFYKNGGVYIESVGLALQNGSKGEKIRVRNLSSRKMVLGEVVGERRVKVW